MAKRYVGIGAVARELGLSTSRIRQLTADGTVPSTRTSGGHRRYDLDAVRAAWATRRVRAGSRIATATQAEASPSASPLIDRTLPLSGLQEDLVWREVAVGLDLPAVARTVLAYAFTEMLNNAIDHSSGTTAQVRIWRTDELLTVEIADDGRGIYPHLRAAFSLPDDFAAICELTKGKRTTAVSGHSGEGIFFTSKVVDMFRLASNGLVWTVDNLRGDHAVGTSPVVRGTLVCLELDPGTRRNLEALFREFTDDTEFNRTRPVVKLFNLGVDFVSRSEAKRLLAGMEKFAHVEVDFTGVTSVGQGFVDELFRVWPADHPDTRIEPTGMNEAVQFMVARGLPRHPDDTEPGRPASR